MKIKYFGAVYFCFLGCTSSPKGAPTSELAAKATYDTIALAGIASNGHTAVLPHHDEEVAKSTRVEIKVLGMLDCPILLPATTNFELTSAQTDPLVSETLYFGGFNSLWQNVGAAQLKNGTTYILLIKSQRTGKVIGNYPLHYHGDAPWRISVKGNCSDSFENTQR